MLSTPGYGDAAGSLISELLQFALSLLVPGGGQLFFGRFGLGAVVYVLVVVSLVQVTRGMVTGRWARVALSAFACVVFVAGAVEATAMFLGTLVWGGWPWPVFLTGWFVLLVLALVVIVPRRAKAAS